jgi:hypothetical protein
LLHVPGAPDSAGEWEAVGSINQTGPANSRAAQSPVTLEGDSEGFCHVIFFSPTTPPPVLPQASESNGSQLYDFARGCGGAPPSLTLVALNNQGKLLNAGRGCDVNSGGGGGRGFYTSFLASDFNFVSGDGGEVFFTVCTQENGQSGPATPHQVYVRLGGSRTLEVSRPVALACSEVPCPAVEGRASADYQGASEDGSLVYFTAPLAGGQPPLVPGDADTSNNLYLARIGCPAAKPECGAGERELTGMSEVSHDPNPGQAANVLGVIKTAPDGERAYFVAEGELLGKARREALEGEGKPVPMVGAANLYVSDAASGSIAFIGDLCSGHEVSASVPSVRCPGSGSDQNLWLHEEPIRAQTAGPDGRFFVFTTFAQLNAGDTNPVSDVYRYDAVSGRLDRVSLGEGGFDDNGNRVVRNEQGEALGAEILKSGQTGDTEGSFVEQRELGTRAISEDGSRIVFLSAEPLSAQASNGLENVYEWKQGAGEGSVYLTSSGKSGEPVTDATISPDGSGIFFLTPDGLVAQDTDGLPDVYDARLGPGFPEASAELRPCEGDACQGPLTNPAPLLVPGSVSQAPGENVTPPDPAVQANSTGAKPKAKAKHRRRAKRKHKHTRKHVARRARRTAR